MTVDPVQRMARGTQADAELAHQMTVDPVQRMAVDLQTSLVQKMAKNQWELSERLVKRQELIRNG